jgi:hypothetical protein
VVRHISLRLCLKILIALHEFTVQSMCPCLLMKLVYEANSQGRSCNMIGMSLYLVKDITSQGPSCTTRSTSLDVTSVLYASLFMKPARFLAAATTRSSSFCEGCLDPSAPARVAGPHLCSTSGQQQVSSVQWSAGPQLMTFRPVHLPTAVQCTVCTCSAQKCTSQQLAICLDQHRCWILSSLA